MGASVPEGLYFAAAKDDAGRKAYPLMLPCRPEVIESESLRGAFSAYDASETESQRQLKFALRIAPRPIALATIYADQDAVPAAEASLIDQRRDIPENRAKWRFGLRSEAVLLNSDKGDPA